MKKQGKEGSEKEEKSESSKEAKKEGDTKKGKVAVRVHVGSMMPTHMGPMHDPDPVVRVEKAKNGFIISAHTGMGKEHKEFAKNLMAAPSIIKRIFNVGNKSYSQIKDMVSEDDGEDGK